MNLQRNYHVKYFFIRWLIAAIIIWSIRIAGIITAGYLIYQFWPQVWEFMKSVIFPVIGAGSVMLTIIWAMGVYYDD